jgi:hypothetical protein
LSLMSCHGLICGEPSLSCPQRTETTDQNELHARRLQTAGGRASRAGRSAPLGGREGAARAPRRRCGTTPCRARPRSRRGSTTRGGARAGRRRGGRGCGGRRRRASWSWSAGCGGGLQTQQPLEERRSAEMGPPSSHKLAEMQPTAVFAPGPWRLRRWYVVF